ncbi:unnamed protein product [marine sediment metagenome]|uniref:Uncharacterized protein n=1 Tax=marine sediment metagenome TaxID=412755 RepID=X1BMK7_9ZZZZ
MRTLYVKLRNIYNVEVVIMQEQIKLQGEKYRHADFLQTIPLTNKVYKKLFLKRKPKLK